MHCNKFDKWPNRKATHDGQQFNCFDSPCVTRAHTHTHAYTVHTCWCIHILRLFNQSQHHLIHFCNYPFGWHYSWMLLIGPFHGMFISTLHIEWMCYVLLKFRNNKWLTELIFCHSFLQKLWKLWKRLTRFRLERNTEMKLQRW